MGLHLSLEDQTVGITLKVLGHDDLALLCAIPEALFDAPIMEDQAREFLNEIVLAFDGDHAF